MGKTAGSPDSFRSLRKGKMIERKWKGFTSKTREEGGMAWGQEKGKR